MMKNRTILCLPKEVLQNVADHLPPLDAIRLTHTSHHFYSQLQLHTTSSLQLMKNFVRRDRNDLIQYAFEIPILNDVIFVHTIWVCMNWRDQGWGHRKGRVYIVAKSRDWTRTRIVFISQRAPHRESTLRIPIKPTHDETYHLCYTVGDGGGHELKLSWVQTRALVFDDDTKSAVNAFKFLGGSHVLLPWDEVAMQKETSALTLLSTAKYLISTGCDIPPLMEYLQKFGITSRDLTLTFFDIVEKSYEIWRRKSGVESNPYHPRLLWDVEYILVNGTDPDNNDGDEESNSFTQSNLGEVVCKEQEGGKVAFIASNDSNTVLPISKDAFSIFTRSNSDHYWLNHIGR